VAVLKVVLLQRKLPQLQQKESLFIVEADAL
jgi:hypothetical protein